jgi:polysaccharide pyruvyl transferase WcaK-like protein
MRLEEDIKANSSKWEMRVSGLKRKKIYFIGNFGNGNIGNECTLQAILHHCRKYLTDAEITGVCANPDDVSSRHNIHAIPISDRHQKRRGSSDSSTVKILQKILLEIPEEILRWVKTYLSLKGVDMLIMTGTGMITDDDGGRWGLPYELMKWTFIAKIRHSRVLYVSVGAEPIHHWTTKWFFKLALSLADYRSFRDAKSKEFLQGIGIDVNHDPVYPDLAYSLPLTEMQYSVADERARHVIGVGLLDYSGQGHRVRGGGEHGQYVEGIVNVIAWLIENKYIVRILIGDIKYDNRVKEEIKALIAQRGIPYENMQIIDEPICTVSNLLTQLSQTEMIIASRFHNVLLSLMLNIPAISLSYSTKNDALMSEYGLSRYCQRIDRLDMNLLKEQFVDLRNKTADHLPNLKEKTEEFRRELVRQYDHIFK